MLPVPEDLQVDIYDYLDDCSVIRFHSVSKKLHSTLPNRVPVEALSKLHKMTFQAHAFIAAISLLNEAGLHPYILLCM